MPWTNNDVRWFAARLMVEAYDINQRDRYDRNTRRLEALYAELEPMKFRITQPTFFWGKERQVGEIMEAPTGPYKNTVVGGHGLVRVPQFEEILPVTDTTQPAPVQNAAQGQMTAQGPAAQAGTFAEATASIVKPASAPKPISKTAALLSGLATRRRKLEEMIVTEATAYSQDLASMETSAPAVFTKAKTSLDDRGASLKELSDSLVDFAAANDPL